MVPEIRSETERVFCDFGPLFALLPPPTPTPNDPKNKKFENINEDHMIYGS